MEALLEALRAYQTDSPSRWVSVYRVLPVWGGLLFAGFGVALLLRGTGQALRPVAAGVGALVGLAWTQSVARLLGLPAPSWAVASAVASGLGLAGFLFPPITLFCAFGIPAGLLCAQWAGASDALLGFVPGLLVGGTAAALFHRPVSVVAASLLGAWALVLGLLAALHPFGSFVRTAERMPWLVIGVALALATFACVYQLGMQKSPEEQARQQAEQRRKAQRAAEEAAIQRRWEEEARRRERG